MCGILGLATFNETNENDYTTISNKIDRIKHRGPDKTNILRNQNFVFGHTRLSIIDLDNGTQPIVDETGQYTICFNGEIYNYKEIKEDLFEKGLTFSTNSDTEVLLKGYIYWKEKVVEKIQGMFAFSIWDNEKKQLFSARDPLGQKPFYYTIKNNRFYFSSEASTFKGIEGISNNLSSSAIYSFLNDEAFHGDSTIYSDVKKLEEGHYILWSKEKNKKVKFFNSIPGKVEIENPTISGLKDLLVKHVSMTNRADVPTSLLLSGGLDSSLVLALLRDGNKDNEITSYHVNVKDETFNETFYAKEAARLHNSKLVEVPLDLMSLSGLAMKMPEELDLPQSDPGILPKYLISKEIAKNHKVSLTGDGADELFYGYLIFKAFKMYSYYKYVPNFIQDYMVKPAFGVFKEGSGYMNKGFIFKRFLDGIKGSEHGLSNRWKHGLSNQELESALNKDLLSTTHKNFNDDYFKELYKNAEGVSALSKFTYLYQHTFLSNFVLPNSDRASMLNSLELRTPFLNSEIINYSNALNDNEKLNGLDTKYALKQIALDYFPKSFIYRKKIGFTVPIADLIKKDLKDEMYETFSKNNITKTGFLNYDYVRSLLDTHCRGDRNYYKQLWALYNLQKWMLVRSLKWQ